MSCANFTGKFSRHFLAIIFSVFALAVTLAGPLHAQQFAHIDPLVFTKPFAGANPLPQVLSVASTGTPLAFTATASTSTGGNWLSVSPSGFCCTTPAPVSVIVNADVTLSAGTYSGEVVFTSGVSTILTVPVTLIVGGAGSAFFDNMPGQLSFTTKTGGTSFSSQILQVRNAGTGTLNWTVSGSTFNGAKWLSISAASGTAPSFVTVGIVAANLPGGGLQAGVFTGQLLFQTAGDSITVPISVTIGANVFEQVNPLNFTKPFGGADPLPQTLTIASTGTALAFTSVAVSATGGNWLQVSPSGFCCTTPSPVTVTVSSSVTLAAGTYTAQLEFLTATSSIVVPVSLTVAPGASSFLDNMPGQLSFTLKTGGGAPPDQVLEVRDGGTGSLNWTAATSTFDNGNWLSVTPSSGAAPSIVTVQISLANLPGAGLVAGVFTGQLLFETTGSRVTVPVSVTVGDSVFTQQNGLSFSKPFGGANPLPQTLVVSSTGSAIAFTATASTATGGNWLSVSPSGFCCTTPRPVTVSVNAAPTLAAGTYTGQVKFFSGTSAITVPVTLTVGAANSAFFDNMPGQLSFSLATGGGTPPGQLIQVRNGGSGVLNWTAGTTTADGGNWLTLSVASGTAPSTVTVAIVPQNLPGSGLIAGNFSGQVLFQGAGGIVTVPVTVSVGGNVFAQINGLGFTKPFGGANPLPQTITATSLGSAIAFTATAFSATGGNWLSVTPSGFCCTTPRTLTVSVNASPTLAAGTYSGEVVLFSGTNAITVPVSLTVGAAGSPFFANLPGQLSYSLMTGGSTPPGQLIQIGNGGSGTLNWTAAASTADGGNWLTLSAANGTAPSTLTVGIIPQNLPGSGLIAGSFSGQVLFHGAGGIVTIPVTVSVGGNVFAQMNGLGFTMPFGGANPLPQVITPTSLGSALAFTATAYTATGGNWLSVSPNGFCCTTPRPFTVSVNAPPTLAVGTYTGQVVFITATNAITVPVTLTVAAAGSAFFDNMPGELSFSLAPGGGTPPGQLIQIRNAGAGALDWTAGAATFDGGNWLTVSAASGTAPSTVTVGIVPQNLPSGGLVAGSFSGQVLFQGAGEVITVPITVSVGGNVFAQVNGLAFTMPLGGANPLPQTITTTSLGSAIAFTATAFNATGGNWLSVTPNGFCCTTPRTFTISVNAPPALAAGTYTGEVVFFSATNAINVPVTLTVAPANVAFFDNVQGQMSFSSTLGGAGLTSQPIQIRNEGSGTLDWKLVASTFDGGNWLTISAASGSATSTVTVGVVPQNLPGAALVAGLFTGQLLFQSATSSVTVPISVELGNSVFVQLNGLTFARPFGAANPPSQLITVSSTGSAIAFTGTGTSANGGNWLAISPNGFCCTTPRVITVSVDAAATLANGIYTGQAVFDRNTSAMTVPVTLIIGTLTTVPDVVGLTQAAATTAIVNADLVLGTVTTATSGTVAAGHVISESPVAGTQVNSGSAVNLVVSTGPAQVAVPNVVGLTQAAATTSITNAGLVLGTVTSQSSGTVAAGHVISESPVAGTQVNSGSAVNLVVSTGPAQVAVPNVVGLTQAAATTSITNAGLVLGTVTSQSSGTVAAGHVISESPVAGTQVNSGSAVNLVVSTGPAQVAVPNVVGLTQAAATTSITNAGLVLGTVTSQSSGTVAAGHVISESPVAGTQVNSGSAVNLVVSTGPAQVAVPNVVGLTQAAATTSITNAGLVLGTVTTATSGTVAAGHVISESPVAGTQVNSGSAVNLVVSTGPAQVAVPNVVGLTQAAATTSITNAGLVLGTVTSQSSGTVAAGHVISESPVAGTQVNSGSAVNLVVSTGPAQVAVPNVVGLTQAAATTSITNAGLVLGTVTSQSSGTVAAGHVISESPVAGTQVNSGSAVNLVVSTGPAQVAVPNVVGLTQAAATTSITNAGLVLGTVTSQSSGTVAAGHVISESPVAGTQVNSGSAVNLVVSTGPAQVAVPNVVGLTQAAATTSITNAGLVLGTITSQSSGTVAAGHVISESPVAGTQVNSGSAVNLVVSTGPAQVAVPNVVGLTQAAATTSITNAGLVLGTVTSQASGTVAAGHVISESPVAGTQVNSGSAVNLVVSTGPAQVAVPNVVGLTQAAATTSITNAGLVLGTVTTATSGTVAAGHVISESPVAGTQVNSGSPVNLVVSTGPAQVAVPNVVGLTQAAATTSITNAGLVLGTVTTATSGTVAAGHVISESPVAGTQVNSGSPVNLVVSTGPAQVAVPNVVGLTQAAATTSITNAGLVLGTVTTATSGTVPAGSVISESPVAGTIVNPGSTVSLVVSTGVAPKVVSFNVLFGSQSYNVTTSTRIRLPWDITGIRVVFSKPIVSGNAASLGGVTVTGFAGLGTNTLTWSIVPVPQGNVKAVLSATGSTALKDAAGNSLVGNSLTGGADFTQALKILWGDSDDDGVVSATDLVKVNNATTAPYDIVADMNGDGIVDIADLQIVRARVGTSLP